MWKRENIHAYLDNYIHYGNIYGLQNIIYNINVIKHI
jgi:hypothetical protein